MLTLQKKSIAFCGGLLLTFSIVNHVAAAQAPAAPQHPLVWITLGTQGGPAPNPQRSQPANVLLVGSEPWIVDCGDGVMERFAGAGFAPPQATKVFISHLHVDHIAGLQGIIALHWFRGVSGSMPVTVYGPAGTDKLVAGIVQSMQPTSEIAKVEQPGKWTPADSVKVVIVKGGSDITVNGVRVRAVENSHFDNPPGHPQENGTQSLSYRFDYQGYAVGYTGDTGPSDAVAALEHQVNVLVSEVTARGGSSGAPARPNRPRPGSGQQGQPSPETDAGAATGAVQMSGSRGRMPRTTDVDPEHAAGPGMGQQFGAYHFEVQHLSPENAGKLAAAAGAQRLVFTHLAVAASTDIVAPKIIKQAQQYIKGGIIVAHDLDRF